MQYQKKHCVPELAGVVSRIIKVADTEGPYWFHEDVLQSASWTSQTSGHMLHDNFMRSQKSCVMFYFSAPCTILRYTNNK